MLSEINSIGLRGISGFKVTVECAGWRRLPDFQLVGLPDAAVKEAKERVRSACENSGVRFPDIELTVNLAPADLKKEGSFFDLAILVSILSVSAVIRKNEKIASSCFIGELALSGEVRPVRGILSMAFAAKQAGFTELFVPYENANEASVVSDIRVYGVKCVNQLIGHLNGTLAIDETKYDKSFEREEISATVDLSDVKGQQKAKRAMEIAAAGGHNILMIGPPGSGKSMLSKCLPGILPPMSYDEAVETTMIHSVAGESLKALERQRPFRSPHHTVSVPGLIGGGTNPRPGEVSLAHNGVLFLDEFPEFGKSHTEALRQPVEDGYVTVTRVGGSVTYPSEFMLVCAMNPCKCGYFGDSTHKCTCTPEGVSKYLSKVSGPMLDRMDIQVELPSVTFSEISENSGSAETSQCVRERVISAREFAKKRYGDKSGIRTNAQLSSHDIRTYCTLDDGAKALLENAFSALGLSARAHDKILRVARTIADLANSESIRREHIAEAIQYRSLDRKYWHR